MQTRRTGSLDLLSLFTFLLTQLNTLLNALLYVARTRLYNLLRVKALHAAVDFIGSMQCVKLQADNDVYVQTQLI